MSHVLFSWHNSSVQTSICPRHFPMRSGMQQKLLSEPRQKHLQTTGRKSCLCIPDKTRRTNFRRALSFRNSAHAGGKTCTWMKEAGLASPTVSRSYATRAIEMCYRGPDIRLSALAKRLGHQYTLLLAIMMWMGQTMCALS